MLYLIKMKKLEFSLPMEFKENVKITGKRTKSYNQRKSAQELYEALEHLPLSTISEFQKIINNKPYGLLSDTTDREIY